MVDAFYVKRGQKDDYTPDPNVIREFVNAETAKVIRYKLKQDPINGGWRKVIVDILDGADLKRIRQSRIVKNFSNDERMKITMENAKQHGFVMDENQVMDQQAERGLLECECGFVAKDNKQYAVHKSSCTFKRDQAAATQEAVVEQPAEVPTNQEG